MPLTTRVQPMVGQCIAPGQVHGGEGSYGEPQGPGRHRVDFSHSSQTLFDAQYGGQDQPLEYRIHRVPVATAHPDG